jgi:hypothetical protein
MSGKGFDILEAFPSITESLVDTGIGYLLILFVYPFLHVLIADEVPSDYRDLITIFHYSLTPLRELGYVSIVVAFIVGLGSREPMWVVMSAFRKCKIEHQFARLAYRTLQWELGKGIFKFRQAKENLIDTNPFWKVGTKEYAEFRARLASEEEELQTLKKYWVHEEFFGCSSGGCTVLG